MGGPLSDAELVRIYRDTIGPLYGYVSRRVGGDASLAEDLVQDAWMRAIGHWPASGVPREPLAWLIRVVRNALEAATRDAQAAKVRFDVGLANAEDVGAASARQIEIESAIQMEQQRLRIRQTFLSGAISAATADLRVIEAETDQRRAALARRIDVSRRQLKDVVARVDIGTSAPLEVAQAEVRLLELELALKKAEYDLALIRKQIGK